MTDTCMAWWRQILVWQIGMACKPRSVRQACAPVMLDVFQWALPCAAAMTGPSRQARDWNCCLVVLSPMKMRRLPSMHWPNAAASHGARSQLWGWKTCTAPILFSHAPACHSMSRGLTLCLGVLLQHCAGCSGQRLWGNPLGHRWSVVPCLRQCLCPFRSTKCH